MGTTGVRVLAGAGALALLPVLAVVQRSAAAPPHRVAPPATAVGAATARTADTAGAVGAVGRGGRSGPRPAACRMASVLPRARSCAGTASRPGTAVAVPVLAAAVAGPGAAAGLP